MWKKIGAAVLWCVLATMATTLSAIVHLATPMGRAAAADGIGLLLSSRVRGTAHVDSVTRLDFDGIEMRGFSVRAPSGEPVIAADRMSTEFGVLESFRRGAIVLAPCDLEGGEMRISRGPHDQIDLVWAMEVPDDRFMIPVEIRDIRLLHQTIVFALPGIPGELQLANVYGLVDMTLGHQFVCRMDQLHGYVNIPIVHLGFDRLNGRIQSDDATPLVVRMALNLEVADPTMGIRYTAPGALGRPGSGSLQIELGADVPDEHHVATARHVADAR